MKPVRINRLLFPIVTLTTAIVCALVFWNFGSPSKKITKIVIPAKSIISTPKIASLPSGIEHKPPVLSPNAQPEMNPPIERNQFETKKPKILSKKCVSKRKPKIQKQTAWNTLEWKRINRAKTIVVEEIGDEFFNVEETSAINFVAPLDKGIRVAQQFQLHPTEEMRIVKEARSQLPEQSSLVLAQSEEKSSTEEPSQKDGESFELVKSKQDTQVLPAPGGVSDVQALPPNNMQKDSDESTVEQESESDLEIEPEVIAKRSSPSALNNAGTPITSKLSPGPKLVIASAKRGVVDSKVGTVLPAPHPNPRQPQTTQNLTTQKGRVTNEERTEVNDAGDFFGKIYIDTPLRRWLSENKAHFELNLYRETDTKTQSQSRVSYDPQDMISIDYEFGEDEFEFEGASLNGTYRLVAAFYSGTGATPVGQIIYPKRLSSGDYKKRLIFELKKSELDKNASSEASHKQLEPHVINVTVFKGGAGNYREAMPVSTAYVQVIGHKEWGTFTSDSEGNIRIPKIFGRSEYVLEVGAPGYYPTRQTIPVFDHGAYAAIYLIAKEDVYSITHYFTKHPQQEGKAVVMGRVFNPKTRIPKKEEEISLSFRKGRAVYFKALPDLGSRSTTETGVFGFYNVEPSMRSIQRGSEKYSGLINLPADYGIYYEFGRGGEKDLRGRVFDPYGNIGVSASIHIVGDENNEQTSSEEGYFTLPRLDLSPGVVTLEVKAGGFPVTWHTLPWNVREPDRQKNLFVLEKEVLEESRKINQVLLEQKSGILVGGAEEVFFSKTRSCVQVRLEDLSGNRLSKEKGPFPIAGAKDPSKGFCLTKSAPGFAFFNVPSGEYVLKWEGVSGVPFRSRVVRVGIDRVSVVVN